MTESERRNQSSSSRSRCHTAASVPRVDDSVVGPTALRRKCNDGNASGLGGRGPLVLSVRPGGVFGALKQTVAFGIVDLLGHEIATDAAAVQHDERIGF